MATPSATTPPPRRAAVAAARRVLSYCSKAVARPLLRELLILSGFTVLAAIMTWPWVTRLRDACADNGDPYVHTWVMWWDYHQTFHDPLHLFNGNIFYPLPYTLAFTENDYGIALLFFPLYALGFHPLTVLSVATFLGFAFCGYGAFRLTRTLTGSSSAAWVAGVVFAFIPYRFHVLSQITYVFAGWLPLLLEALVLFARVRSRKRAAWLAVAFTMNALSGLTWMTLSLLPLLLSAIVLIIHYRLWRDRAFWVRGAIAAAASVLVLLPFLLPYLYVSKMFGFSWTREALERNSPGASRWLVAEYRNKLWKGFGDNLPGAGARLFPGLLPLLLAIAAVLIIDPFKPPPVPGVEADDHSPAKLVKWLDILAVAAGLVALVAAGWIGSVQYWTLGKVFEVVNPDRAILLLVLSLVFRLALSYPQWLRRATGAANLVENIRASRRGLGFWLAAIWAVTGFFLSIGMNSWLYRVLFDLVFVFHSMREPSRGAMVACVGLSVLAGIGAVNLAAVLARNSRRVGQAPIVALIVLALLFELRAAPLNFMRGAVYPDAVTLRLKETPMRGGLVELPTGGGTLPHLYMLRAADHGRPLINANSTFVPQHAWEIEVLSKATPISPALLDVLEKVPTSYLVIHNSLIDPNRLDVYQSFLIGAMVSGRLRFIRRFDDANDLYAVVKTEPNARSETPAPFGPSGLDWATMIKDDPVKLLGSHQVWSQEIYRIHLVAIGELPRYREFIEDAETTGRNVHAGFEEDRQFQDSIRDYANAVTRRGAFAQKYHDLNDGQYVERLLANAGLSLNETERAALLDDLKQGRETRAGVLLKIANDPRLIEKEHDRSVVLLHFFAYLHRNPGDPPEKNTSGFDYWIAEVKKHGGSDLEKAFANSAEYRAFAKRTQ